MDLQTIVWTCVAPAFICVLCLLPRWRPWRAIQQLRGDGRWATACAFAAGFCICSGFQLGWPELPPQESWQWLTWLSLLGIPLMVAAAGPRRVLVSAVFALSALSAVLIVPPWQQPTWVWMLLLGVVVLGWQALLNPLALRWTGGGLPLVLMLTCTGCAFVLYQAGNLKSAMLCGILSSMCLVCAVAGLATGRLSLHGGALGVVSVVLPALMFYAFFYSEYARVPGFSYFAVLGVPLLPWLGELPVLRHIRPWENLALRVSAALLLLVVACVLAYTGEVETEYY